MKKKKLFEGANRRRWSRLEPDDIPSLKGVAINQGTEAQVVDISMGGILLNTKFRLRPNMSILLKVVTTKGIFKVTGNVLRSSIKSISGAPVYESAIVFDAPLTALNDLHREKGKQTAPPPARPAIPNILADHGDGPSTQPSPGKNRAPQNPAMLTAVASERVGTNINKMIAANDW